MLEQQHFVFGFPVPKRPKGPNEMSLRISRIPRPRIDRDNDALTLQRLRLAGLNADLRDLSFGWNENVSRGPSNRVHLQNSTILTPFAANDSDYFARWSSFRDRNLVGGSQFYLLKNVTGIILIVLQNQFARYFPLILAEQFDSNDVAVDGSIQSLVSLEQNLQSKNLVSESTSGSTDGLTYRFFHSFYVDETLEIVFSRRLERSLEQFSALDALVDVVWRQVWRKDSYFRSRT